MLHQSSRQLIDRAGLAETASGSQLSALYKTRFEETGLAKRRAVWRVLCEAFFSKLIAPDAAVLDLACGYGEFINNIRAGQKNAIDLNPDAPRFLDPDIRFVQASATDLSAFAPASMDVVFTSNFFEHLRDKPQLDDLLAQVLAVLKPGGRLICVGPNIRYAYREYWDYYDHHLALSHASLEEALSVADFQVEEVIDRFLPYTMKGKTPTHDLLIRLYLALPFAWKLLGKQFLVIARKPT